MAESISPENLTTGSAAWKQAEENFLKNYHPEAYDRPSVTVDIVIFTVMDNDLKVLLIQRKSPPYQGMWAIPGGFIEMGETLEAAALRELKEETGVDRVYLEQLYTFGDPQRDPRTRVITVAYMALVEAGQVQPLQAGSDAREADWYSVYKLPELAFDHSYILNYALKRLRSKLEYTNVAFQLVPEKFTLTELQRVYEIVWNEKLDKRNFRKRLSIKERDAKPDQDKNYMLEELEETRPGGNYGPTKLYRFVERVERIVRS
ncbi:MAG TPA: NUDIX domain-containing protein [Chloroflexia bacterium]|nr:NUDIX domain-containing protein [Chloroflexia bacterium]